MKRQVEILSPAGSYESLKAAIAAGADAVYIGGSRFGARAFADNLNEEKLFVKECYADESITMKRFRPRGKGSASPILKRTSHITVVVSERD